MNFPFALGILGQSGSEFKPKAIKEKNRIENTTLMMKWINNSPPGNPIQLVPVNWSVCVLLRQHWQILFNSFGFQPQTLSPSWSDRNGRSWSPWMLCFPQSLLTASHPQQDHLPSQLIGMFVLHICLCS